MNNENTKRILFYVLILLIILIYFQHYRKYNTEYKILQAYLDNIDHELLKEKYPILLYDKVVSPQDLIESLFYGLYMFKREDVLWIGNPILSSAKYLLIFNNLSNCYINLVSPKYRNIFSWRKQNGYIISNSPLSEMKVEFMTIKLKKNQIFILPPYWIYQTANKVKRIELADFPSKIYETLFKMGFKIHKKD